MNPLATSLLEGTALAMLGIMLFQLRHHAGLVPYLFLTGALALCLPFVAHATQATPIEGWTLGHAYAVVVPVFLGLVLLLHTLTGPRNAVMMAAMPALAGLLAAVASLTSGWLQGAVPQALLPPSAMAAIVTGLALAGAAAVTVWLFQWWHENLLGLPLVALLIAAAGAGLLVHGALVGLFLAVGVPVPGVTWPAIVAAPLVAGTAPLVLLGVYADGILAELGPLARRREHVLADRPVELEAYRRADARYHQALVSAQEAATTYRELTDAGGEPAFLCDEEGRFLHVNEPLGELLGRDPERLVGADVTEHLLRDPRPAQPSPEAPSAKGPRARTWHVDHQTASGDPRVLRIHVETRKGRTLRGTVQDVTEAVLEAKLEDVRAKARFTLALLVHDLPNHLVAPATNLELLGEEPSLTPEGRELVATTRRRLQEVTELLDRLAVLDEVDPDETCPVDVRALLHDAAEAHHHRHPDQLTLQWDLPPEPIHVQAAPALATVFENLLENACHHGGPDPTVHIQATSQGDGWLVTLADDGPGLPSDLRDRVLAGFSHAPDGRRRGIGLPLSATILATLGGRIWLADRVEGAPGSGLAVHVWLPEAVGGEPKGPSGSAGSIGTVFMPMDRSVGGDGVAEA